MQIEINTYRKELKRDMIALITGASSGIGKDMARRLSELGYDLILVARRKERLEDLQKRLKTKVKIIDMDLSVEKNLYRLYDLTKNDNIDILINNAGFGLFGVFNKTDLDTELKMIDTNIKAVHILTKLYLKDFVKRNSGYILNVASMAGFMSGPHLNTYYATKNYVLKLTMAIYEELKEQNSNVHISALCPGPVKTEFNEVARGGFILKGMSSKEVAVYAVNKMFKNKLIIIPDFKNKLAIFFLRFVPYKLQLKIVAKIQLSKNK